MDAIALLREDHRTVEKLFKRFEGLSEGPGKMKEQIVQRIIEELSVHAVIEEQVFYPAVRETIQEAEGEVLEDLEEHHVVKWTLSELEDMTSMDERFDAKVRVLMENVRHHVKEEEKELFPMVRQAMGRKRLLELGEQLKQAKTYAPRRPHPRAPDTPPMNIVAGVGAAAVDAVRTIGGKAVGTVLSPVTKRGRKSA